MFPRVVAQQEYWFSELRNMMIVFSIWCEPEHSEAAAATAAEAKGSGSSSVADKHGSFPKVAEVSKKGLTTDFRATEGREIRGAECHAGNYVPDLKYEEMVHGIQVESRLYNPDLNVDFGLNDPTWLFTQAKLTWSL